jgi:hypothetical protein
MKYIRTEILGIVTFSDSQSHDVIAKRLMSENDEMLSAGFVRRCEYIDDGQITCGGRSMTLGIGSREEDTDILRRMIGG